VSKKPRAIFTGVGLIGYATLYVPDKEEPHKLKHTAWHIPDIRRIEAGDLPVDKVYPELLTKAFAKLTTKFLAPLIEKS
jgi:hypothetical protein